MMIHTYNFLFEAVQGDIARAVSSSNRVYPLRRRSGSRAHFSGASAFRAIWSMYSFIIERHKKALNLYYSRLGVYNNKIVEANVNL